MTSDPLRLSAPNPKAKRDCPLHGTSTSCLLTITGGKKDHGEQRRKNDKNFRRLREAVSIGADAVSWPPEFMAVADCEGNPRRNIGSDDANRNCPEGTTGCRRGMSEAIPPVNLSTRCFSEGDTAAEKLETRFAALPEPGRGVRSSTFARSLEPNRAINPPPWFREGSGEGRTCEDIRGLAHASNNIDRKQRTGASWEGALATAAIFSTPLQTLLINFVARASCP